MNHLVEIVEPANAGVFAGDLSRAIELVGEHLVEDVVDERRLARTAHPGHGHKHPERELRGDIAQIIGASALNGDLAVLVDRAAGPRGLDRAPTRQVIAGHGPRVREKLLVRT